MIALTTAVVISAIGLYQGFGLYVVSVGFMFVWFLALLIQNQILPNINQRLSPNVTIEVDSCTYGQGYVFIPEKTLISNAFSVSMHFHILNNSSANRVSLRLDYLDLGTLAYAGQGLRHEGLRLNLGPGEDTSGEIVAAQVPGEYRPNGNTHKEMRLYFTDRLSGRKASMRIPGGFPEPKRR